MEQSGFQIIASSIVGILKIFLVKESLVMIISATAVAGLTFGLLDLFLKPGLNLNFSDKKLSRDTHDKLVASFLLIIVSAIPVIVAFLQAISIVSFDRRHSFSNVFIGSMEAIIISFLVCLALSWLLSFNLKRFTTDKKIKKQQFLVGYALKSILEITGENIADWISRLITGIIDIGIRIIHKPFVMEYAIVAVVLNLVFSFMLIQIMGVSNSAGSANLLGSLIGGLLHYFIRKQQIAELRAKYQHKRRA